MLYRLILTSEDRRGNPIMGFNPLLKPSMQQFRAFGLYSKGMYFLILNLQLVRLGLRSISQKAKQAHFKYNIPRSRKRD